jgi:hypothetical protein
MQSFKQFLKEEAGNIPVFYISIMPTSDYFVDHWSQAEDICNKVLEHNNVKDGAVTYKNDNISVSFNVTRDLQSKLDDIYVDIHGYLVELSDLDDAGTFYECIWPPAFPLTYSEASVLFKVERDGLSLKGIEKIVADFKHIDFSLEGHKIGLLPLANLKNTNLLAVTLDHSIGDPNQKILNKILQNLFYDKPSVDMLEFQEELIEAGLKDYAKL